MILIFFSVCAPLVSSRWRRFAALGSGMIAETFFSIPFGAMLGLFFLITFFIELLEQRLVMTETAGWAIAAFSALGIAIFGETAFAIAFDHASLLAAFALLVSKLIISIILIGFLWTPVKLNLAHFKQR